MRAASSASGSTSRFFCRGFTWGEWTSRSISTGGLPLFIFMLNSIDGVQVFLGGLDAASSVEAGGVQPASLGLGFSAVAAFFEAGFGARGVPPAARFLPFFCSGCVSFATPSTSNTSVWPSANLTFLSNFLAAKARRAPL